MLLQSSGHDMQLSESQNQWAWLPEVRRFTEALMSIATISPDAAGENECAALIADLLSEGNGLQPEMWLTNDGRANVACLLVGEHPQATKQTILLMGHYDTVGVKEFKALDPLTNGRIAFAPAQLRAVLTQKLSHSRTTDEEEVWQDLNEKVDGEWAWLFGRGSCDMKSGVAINIALMRHLWTIRQHLCGNVLFVACPDEENESTGVRAAVQRLLDARDEYNLDYLGLINTDYAAPRNRTDDGRSIYVGTVGKLLPAFYILGVPTHVGEPFRGVDAGQIAAEIVRRVNLNTELCDRWVREDPENEKEMRMETGVPPITLKVRDLKSGYNVQTAAEAFVYINWLTYTTTPAEALEVMMNEARQALKATLDHRNEQYQLFNKGGDLPTQFEPRVISYAQLCQMVREVHGWAADDLAFEHLLNNLAQEIDFELNEHSHDDHRIAMQLGYTADLRTKSRLLVSRLIRLAGLQGPTIIVFFAPPYYPHVHPVETPITEAFKSLLRDKRAAGIEPGVHLQGFYPYISDLSFVRLDDEIQEQVGALSDNMPVFNRGYTLDFEAMRDLNLPVMNFGPWGKDAHGLYERVHMPYSFETVPQLIFEAVTRVLVENQGS